MRRDTRGKRKEGQMRTTYLFDLSAFLLIFRAEHLLRRHGGEAFSGDVPKQDVLAEAGILGALEVENETSQLGPVVLVVLTVKLHYHL